MSSYSAKAKNILSTDKNKAKTGGQCWPIFYVGPFLSSPAAACPASKNFQCQRARASIKTK